MVSIFSKFNPVKKVRQIFVGSQDDQVPESTQSFNVRQEKEEAYESIKRGTSMVPMERIIGSVGRYHDFDNQFRTKSSRRDERLQRIKDAMMSGKVMPPISLYQIKDDFYIHLLLKNLYQEH